MIRYLRIALTALVALVLLVLALANRDPVALRLLPGDMGAYLGVGEGIQMPMFVVILITLLVGLALGFSWEWARESGHRKAARAHARQAAQLKREVSTLRTETQTPQDEVLALLDRPQTLPAPR
ncbi:lipopolysaccharide assembly protein LapA domain-containing protein [Frigidibacter sp. MR17.14]|uniref:lipopolysaccharide assembly protein LapA domain-containing protein n=1 Tax=Frigidibacter sp. MR17.14 TaxID=3126509 RepID=UPI00301310FA